MIQSNGLFFLKGSSCYGMPLSPLEWTTATPCIWDYPVPFTLICRWFSMQLLLTINKENRADPHWSAQRH